MHGTIDHAIFIIDDFDPFAGWKTRLHEAMREIVHDFVITTYSEPAGACQMHWNWESFTGRPRWASRHRPVAMACRPHRPQARSCRLDRRTQKRKRFLHQLRKAAQC